MTITLIGSCKEENKEKMLAAKDFFRNLGNVVNCPCDDYRENMPLLKKQSEWIEKIKQSDLIVAVNKETHLSKNGDSEITLKFGESTSYEMAIALSLDKIIVMW